MISQHFKINVDFSLSLFAFDFRSRYPHRSQFPSLSSISIATMLRLACSILLSGVFCFSAALAQVYTTVDEAKVDPDFELQGEYRDATRGVQAIALGDGGFSVVVYTGGLPGTAGMEKISRCSRSTLMAWNR